MYTVKAHRVRFLSLPVLQSSRALASIGRGTVGRIGAAARQAALDPCHTRNSPVFMRSSVTALALASVLLCSNDVAGYALGGVSSHRLPHLPSRSHRASVAPVLSSVSAQPSEPAPGEDENCLVGKGGDGCVGTTGTVPMAINLAKNIAGAGVLSLSAGIASFSGAKAAVLPATLLLLFLGAVSAYSFSLLARVGEDLS